MLARLPSIGRLQLKTIVRIWCRESATFACPRVPRVSWLQPRVEERCSGSTAGARLSAFLLHISCIGDMSPNRQLCMIIAHVMLPGDADEEDMNVK